MDLNMEVFEQQNASGHQEGLCGVTPDGYLVATDTRAAISLLNLAHAAWERNRAAVVIVILPDREDEVAWVAYDVLVPVDRAKDALAVYERRIKGHPRNKDWRLNSRRLDILGRPTRRAVPKDPQLAKRLWWATSFPISAGHASHLARDIMQAIGATRVTRGDVP